MKYIKLSIVILVLLGIAFFTLKSVEVTNETDDVIEVSNPENQFTKRIQKEINELDSIYGLQNTGKHYKKVLYLIDDYAQNNKFSTTTEDNQQWAESFRKKSYAIYVDKFIEQAFKVFKGNKWAYNDLRFIGKESRALQKSTFLQKKSSARQSLTEIQRVLNTYNEMASFVTQCKNFKYISSELEDKFPLDEVRNKISKAKNYKQRGGYIKNCTRLKEQLNKVPQILFNTHIQYLDSKIDEWRDMYMEYMTQSDYVKKLYTPIVKEIYQLSRAIYKVPNFDKEYERLKDKWQEDNRKAYKYEY